MPLYKSDPRTKPVLKDQQSVKSGAITDPRIQQGVASPVALNFREALKWLGLIAGQAALLGALLFYFGWVRTQSLLRYFGLDNNIIQLSWNDYVLRSPNVVIRALTLACSISMLLAIVGALLWTYVAPRSRNYLWLSLLSYALAVVALALGLLGYFNIVI